MTSITNHYVPDATAIPGSNLSTALLSQRDLSLAIPINFVTHASVSLRTCFSTNVYEDTAARKCISNLLAAGFRRFILDVYWDYSRSAWSLCPVMLGSAAPPDSSTTSPSPPTATSESSLSNAPLSFASTAGAERIPYVTTVDSPPLNARQAISPSTTSLESPSTSITSSADVSPSVVSNTPETLYQIGEYKCTTSIDLGFVGHILSDFFSASGYNTNATINFLILNLHTAGNPSGSISTVPTSELPAPGNLVADVLNSTLFSYLYTPDALRSDRANLNDSWYASGILFQPDHAYLDLHTLPDGNIETYGGWPTEGFLEFYRFKRLLIGYGSIDQQFANYDVSLDGTTIFSPGYLSTVESISTTASGTIDRGCYFDANTTHVSAINNSFAITENEFGPSAVTDIHTLLHEANNATSCGLSPLLNQTLFNVPANVNGSAYNNFVGSTIWSWYVYDGQPYDNSSGSTTVPGDHCAVLNLTTQGKWHTTSCSGRHYGACRVGSQPYLWVPTEMSGQYDAISRVCPDNSTFAAPRTALENSYLISAMQTAYSSGVLDSDDTSIWVNFNDLDVSGCWVAGANQTCPYVQHAGDTTRKVTVPTVAAVIVFVLVALTLFSKVAANRTSRKRRRSRKRMGDGGWDYEGVPS
ncbi:hypothetical protein MBLNU457_g2612t1 [Dothideomycetes sp. NU457]